MEMKERIQQTAKELFHRYGIKSITMDEIATQVGASKKTIYQYFSDKDELVDAIVREMTSCAQHSCDDGITASRDAIHEAFQGMDYMQDLFADLNPALMHDLARFHPRSYKIFLDHKNKYMFQVIRTNLKRGIEEGLYRPDIQVDVLARFRLEAMMMAFNQDLFPSNKFNLAELQTTIVEHFLFGVASLKGYKLILKYQQERIKKPENEFSSRKL